MLISATAWVVLLLSATPADATPADATSADATATPVIEQEIVVTAARYEQPLDQASAAMTVLDRQAIEHLPATTLAELLAFVPGVTMMFDSGASGRPIITSRGFFGGGEVEYVKLIVDGVPVGDSESGNVDWQRFRVSDIERLEVLHGPGSALYGDTALGGVIQVFTSGEQRASGGALRLGLGSFGSNEGSASYRMDLSSSLRLDGQANAWSTDGFRDQAEADGHDGSLALEHLGDRWRWRIEGQAERQQRQQPGALTRVDVAADRQQSEALFRFDDQTTTRSRLGATLEWLGPTPVRATLYGARRDDDNLRTLLLAPGFGSSAFRALTTDIVGGTLDVSRQGAHGFVRVGTDLERADLVAGYAAVGEDGALGSITADENGRRDRLGLFVTGGWTFADRYRLSAGLRYDEIGDDLTFTSSGGSASGDGQRRRDTSSAWSPRVGLNVRLGPSESPVFAFVQLARAFKAPTLDQLFDQRPYPDGAGGTFTISNPDLLPQRARNLEVGLSRSTLNSEWSIVGYRMNVRDEIDFDPQTFTYRNIGTSLHRGVEASLALAKEARFSPRLTYAWTRVVDSTTPDLQLKNIPEHSAQLLLRWRIAASSRADIVYRWRDRVTIDDGGLFREPELSRVDLRLAHDWRNLRLQVDVLNVFDAQYNELGYVLLDFVGQPTALEFPAPGRALRLGVTWMLNP